MEFKLNEDQQMIHDLAKDFAESVLQPRIDEIEAGEMTEVSNGQKHPQLPHDIHQQLAECGFIGISFPEEYNGMGMGHVEQAIVIKELSRVSPSVGKCLDVYILGLEALDLYANHEQKMKYLAPCCSGEQTVSFAFTEPETGSDPKMLKTRLEKQADGTYKLNGVARPQIFAFDTENALINVIGTASFASEQLDLTIDPESKGIRIITLRSPLYVRGTFKNPQAGVKAGPLIARGAVAAALATLVTPAAALLALISPSEGEANQCRTILSQMKK